MKKMFKLVLDYSDEIICIGFISYMVILAIAKVGELPTHCSEPYEWWMPFLLLAVLTLPALLGYRIGEKHKG